MAKSFKDRMADALAARTNDRTDTAAEPSETPDALQQALDATPSEDKSYLQENFQRPVARKPNSTMRRHSCNVCGGIFMAPIGMYSEYQNVFCDACNARSKDYVDERSG